MNKSCIFLDDLRMPIDVFGYIEDLEYTEDKWTVVRNYDEFTNAVQKYWDENNSLPVLLSFDHDLGEEHIEYYFNNGGHDNPPDPLLADFKEKTGYVAAKWLVDFCIDNNVRLPKYKVHSKNPVGKENIEGLLNNFRRFQDLNLE